MLFVVANPRVYEQWLEVFKMAVVFQDSFRYSKNDEENLSRERLTELLWNSLCAGYFSRNYQRIK